MKMLYNKFCGQTHLLGSFAADIRSTEDFSDVLTYLRVQKGQ
jgi:hypothetical protein